MTALTLADPLPLRTTAVWGAYEDVAVIPWIFGTARVTPLLYNTERTLFVVADHPILGIDAVTRDDAETLAWTAYNGLDSTGKAVAFLQLDTALEENEGLAAEVRGYPHQRSGANISLAADISWHIVTWCGWSTAYADLAAMRAETAICGGAITETMTLRAALASVFASINATWSGELPGLARLAPDWANEMVTATLPATEILAPQATSVATELATVLRLEYAYDASQSQPTQVVTLQAASAVAQYGEIVQTLDARWLRQARDAVRIGTRLLQDRARPQWAATFGVPWHRHALRPGQLLDLNHAWLPVSRALITNSELNLASATVNLTATAPAGVAPAITLVSSAGQMEPLTASGVGVTYRDGIATLTLLDDKGLPLAGATVTLDPGAAGQQARVSDNTGKVQFACARGTHPLHVEALGYAAMEAQIVI